MVGRRLHPGDRINTGAIPADYPIYVVSPNTAHAALTKANIDGSFSAQIVAPPGSWVIVKYDPTGGYWLNSEIFNQSGSPHVNAAIGAMAQVPFEPPSGNGVPFVISGSTYLSHLDFTLKGLMAGTFESGGSVTLSGIAIVYAAEDSTVELTGQRLEFGIQLTPLFNYTGQPRIMANQFFSTILTPSRLPIEHWRGFPLAGGLLQTNALQPVEGADTLTTPFTFQLEIPEGTADGVYTVWLDAGGDSVVELIGSLGGPRPDVNPFMANNALALPPFTIGPAASPHLIWTLLTDVPSADGSRGTMAAGDAADFQIANRFGVFTPPLDAKNIEMTRPGELLVETTASYIDPDGVLWMGATRWGQVVAPTDTPLLAHGRRVRDNTPINGGQTLVQQPESSRRLKPHKFAFRHRRHPLADRR